MAEEGSHYQHKAHSTQAWTEAVHAQERRPQVWAAGKSAGEMLTLELLPPNTPYEETLETINELLQSTPLGKWLRSASYARATAGKSPTSTLRKYGIAFYMFSPIAGGD